MSPKIPRIRPGPSHPTQHAEKIAEQVVEAWYGHHGSGRYEIPVSVVAALSFLSPPHAERNQVAGELINTDPPVFAQYIRTTWHQYIRARPDLANPVWPLIEPWESESYPLSDDQLRAAKAVGDAALRYDLLTLTGTPDSRHEVDLLGVVLTELRPKSSIQGRGQYYTPAPVAEVMARMLGVGHVDNDSDPAGGPDQVNSINDPACGTGGMLRAAALEMRRAGRDPATVYWEGNDTDALAVACCAVNVVLWELGWNVLLGVGDTIAYDWRDRAIRQREETIGLARDARMLAILRDLDGYLERAAHDNTEGDDEESGEDNSGETSEPAGTQPEPAATEHDEPRDQPDPPAASEPAGTALDTADTAIDLDPADAGALTSEFWTLVDRVITGEEHPTK